MKKECTCKKLIKDDEIIVLNKCKVCRKHDIKVFDKAIELAKVIIKLHIGKNTQIPDYKKGSKVEPEIVTDEVNKDHLSKSKSKFQQRLDEIMEKQKKAKEQ